MITPDEEFLNPEINYRILLSELRQKLETLQEDLSKIQDPAVLGFAEKQYLHYKERYFNILVYDLDLKHREVIRNNLDGIADAIFNSQGDRDE